MYPGTIRQGRTIGNHRCPRATRWLFRSTQTCARASRIASPSVQPNRLPGPKERTRRALATSRSIPPRAAVAVPADPSARSKAPSSMTRDHPICRRVGSRRESCQLQRTEPGEGEAPFHRAERPAHAHGKTRPRHSSCIHFPVLALAACRVDLPRKSGRERLVAPHRIVLTGGAPFAKSHVKCASMSFDITSIPLPRLTSTSLMPIRSFQPPIRSSLYSV